MKDKSVTQRSAFPVGSSWTAASTMEEGGASSAAEDSAEDDYEEERSSEGGRASAADDDEQSSSPAAAVKSSSDYGRKVGPMFDDDDGAGPEPGKYNFQLLPGHCVRGRQGNKLFKCDICGGVYRHAFSLKRHYLRTHVNYDYLSQSDIANCNINMEAHNKEKAESGTSRGNACLSHLPPSDVYRCHICGSLFADVYTLKDHVVNHPNNTFSKRFCCTQCDMTFSHKQNLVRHLSVHSGVKPYACKHCGKAFPTATNQRRHERIHQGLKPYLCPHCQSNFSQSGDLKKHIRKLHREFFHPCAFCMKYFAHQTQLQEHVVSHGKSLELNHRILEKKVVEETVGNASNPTVRGAGSGGATATVESGAESSSCSVEAQPPALVIQTQTFVTVTSPLRQSPSQSGSATLESINRRFSCNVCDKRFHTNLKLQRHRNIAHPRPGSLVAARRITRRSPETVQFYDRFPEPSPFFANVSQNIAHNLQYYLDGKLSQELATGAGSADESSSQSSAFREYGNFSVVDFTCLGQHARGLKILNSCGESSEPSDDGDRSTATHPSNILDLTVNVRPVHDVDAMTPSASSSEEDPLLPTVTKSPPTKFLCHACGECFATLVLIEEHKVNNHPNVHCTHVEVDSAKDVPLDLFKYQCSPEGVLLKCPLVPVDAFKPLCTKCAQTFASSGELHEHILVCGGHVDGRDIRQGCAARLAKRVVRRGMKRCLDISDDNSSAQKRRFRKPKKDTFWDWMPSTEQQQQQQNLQEPEVKQDARPATQTVSLVPFVEKPSVANDPALMCDGCNQKFKYLSALERHQKFCLTEALHRGQKARELRHLEHCCPYCGRHFTYPASLKKHVSDSCPLKSVAEVTTVVNLKSLGQALVAADASKKQIKLKTQLKSKTKLSATSGTSLISVQKVAKLAAKKQEKRTTSKVVKKTTPIKKELPEDDPKPNVGLASSDPSPPPLKRQARVLLSPLPSTSKQSSEEARNTKASSAPSSNDMTRSASPSVEAVIQPSPVEIATPILLRPLSPSSTPPLPPPSKRSDHSTPPLPSTPSTARPPTPCPSTQRPPTPPQSPPSPRTPLPRTPSPRTPPLPPPRQQAAPPTPPPATPSPPPALVLASPSLSKVLSDKMKGGLMGLLTQSSHRPDYFACPDCKRTFTYLANFKKHLNVLCPLRSQKDEDGGDLKKEDDEEAEDEADLDVPPMYHQLNQLEEGQSPEENVDGQPSNEQKKSQTSSHRCSVCHKPFNEYVEMLKHRLLHKLKNSGGAAGGALKSRVGRPVRLPARLVNGNDTSNDVTTGSGGRGRGRGRGRGGGRGRGAGGRPKKHQLKNGLDDDDDNAAALEEAAKVVIPLRRGCRVRKPSAAAKLGMDNVSLIDDDEDSEDYDGIEAAVAAICGHEADEDEDEVEVEVDDPPATTSKRIKSNISAFRSAIAKKVAGERTSTTPITSNNEILSSGDAMPGLLAEGSDHARAGTSSTTTES